ncbi:MAG TPA: hypothetical protein VMJ10_17060 [Kofleriaceae bacterium]|nr:hypothetical protein [Kofleriaceae bacterium]
MPKVTAATVDATPAEIEAAIAALSDVDIARLVKVRDFFAYKLRALGLGVEGKDLLQEAITRTYAGDRHWKKNKVSFVKHLEETMRSIASHVPDELKGGIVVRAAEDVSPRGREGVPVGGGTPDSRRVASAREQLAAIRKTFADDVEVLMVLEQMEEEKSGPEIQRELGITENDYETIMLRLRRGIDRDKGWRV